MILLFILMLFVFIVIFFTFNFHIKVITYIDDEKRIVQNIITKKQYIQFRDHYGWTKLQTNYEKDRNS